MKNRFIATLALFVSLIAFANIASADTLTLYFGNSSRVDYSGKFGDIAPSSTEANQVEFYHEPQTIPWTTCGFSYLFSTNCIIPSNLTGSNLYALTVKGNDDNTLGTYTNCHAGIPAYIGGELSLSVQCPGNVLPTQPKRK